MRQHGPASNHNNPSKGSSVTDTNYKRFSCAHCKQQFEATREKKFCSRKCNKAFLRKSGSSVTRAEYLERVQTGAACRFACEHCGVASSRRPGGANIKRGYVSRFCSMKCKLDAAALARPGDACTVWASHCATCSAAFVARRKRAFCSDACKPKRKAVSTAPEFKVCKHCSVQYATVYTGGSLSDYCGALCRDVVIKAAKRADKAKRKAIKAGATVESVDPFTIFDRDKWRCQLCGVKTPRAKRGSYDDDAPELDHIMPLSKGGAHAYINTQCSCRKCNAAKSDRPLGQTLMFG